MEDTNITQPQAQVDERGLGKNKKITGHIVINTTENPDAKWYVVHTTSGHEVRVAETLRQRVDTMQLSANVFELLVPTQDRVVIRGGKKATIKEKIFPGYLLVKMILDDPTWVAVRTTPGITGFVGTGKTPTRSRCNRSIVSSPGPQFVCAKRSVALRPPACRRDAGNRTGPALCRNARAENARRKNRAAWQNHQTPSPNWRV